MINNWLVLKRLLRSVVPMALGLCVILPPKSARAANNCPWINEATASGLLSGDATGTVTDAAAGQPTVCTFVSRSKGSTHTLDDRMGGLGERVLGRVRDQVFLITISSTQKRDSVLSRSALKARISTAAEQVSGNLF
jgi:hypothetical protein